MSKLFEYYIANEEFHFKYAKGKPSVRGREFHDYDEIVLFLDGNSYLISKNIQLELSPKSVILVPRENFHQFNITNPNNYERCILGFKGISELYPLINQVLTDVTVISNPNSNILDVFESLMRIAKSNLSDEEKSLFVKSSIVTILIELKLFKGEQIEKYISVSSQTQNALKYIDKHYAEDLSLESIARFLNVSVSSLSHRFSKDLNISVYKYITEKRISVTRQYIEKGIPLHEAAFLSGFKDYSNFFRLYKKHFGNPPSKR